MAIDTKTETLVSLREASKSLPEVGGRRPHYATVCRWANWGVRGVRLESIRVGHKLCTSTEAVQRFLARLNSR